MFFLHAVKWSVEWTRVFGFRLHAETVFVCVCMVIWVFVGLSSYLLRPSSFVIFGISALVIDYDDKGYYGLGRSYSDIVPSCWPILMNHISILTT